MKPNTPENLARWIRPSTQPKHLDIDHPAVEDIAWAADEITRLSAEVESVKGERDEWKRRGELMHKAMDYVHYPRKGTITTSFTVWFAFVCDHNEAADWFSGEGEK